MAQRKIQASDIFIDDLDHLNNTKIEVENILTTKEIDKTLAFENHDGNVYDYISIYGGIKYSIIIIWGEIVHLR